MTNPCLCIIDMQNDFIGPEAPLPIPGALAVIPQIQSVLSHFRDQKLPVVHIQRIHRRDGSDVELTRRELFLKTPFAVEETKGAAIIDDLAPLPGEYLIRKTRMSSFIATDLDILLRSIGIDTMYITGIQTPNCIRATAFDALAYNYLPVLVRDAIGAQTEEVHESNLRDMAAVGMQIITSGDVAEWLGTR
ncbi:MAG: cysteine hydrolase [Methanospirillaceae archaeon]|nr:cysteine hydrolase [Methanospirillaceae archaeon]